jgi:hypothetical protein
MCISRPEPKAVRFTLIIFALCLGTAAAYGQSAAAAASNASIDPATLPARDVHQGLLIAVNPYTSAEQYKARFGKRTPYEGGILAIEVFFRNDNDLPIRINLKTMQLLVGAPGEARQHLDSLSPEEVADRVLSKPKDPTPRLPIPHPGGIAPKHDKNWEEFAGNVRSAALATDLLPPHATTHGFVYFDIDRHYDWLTNARFDVPDLAFMNNAKPIFFFDIDLAPAIH